MQWKFLDHTKTSAGYAIKTALKKQFKKHQKQRVIWLVIKLLKKLQKFQKVPRKIFWNSKSEMAIPKERDISPEKRQIMIDDLKVI